jgi:hypothetical protein
MYRRWSESHITSMKRSEKIVIIMAACMVRVVQVALLLAPERKDVGYIITGSAHEND